MNCGDFFNSSYVFELIVVDCDESHEVVVLVLVVALHDVVDVVFELFEQLDLLGVPRGLFKRRNFDSIHQKLDRAGYG